MCIVGMLRIEAKTRNKGNEYKEVTFGERECRGDERKYTMNKGISKVIGEFDRRLSRSRGYR